MTSNRLKAIFVAVYPPLIVVIGLGAIAGLILSDARTGWMGALLTVLPFIVLFVRATLNKDMPRTSRSLPVASMLTAAGGALAAYGLWRDGMSAVLPAAAATAGVAGFFLYVHWYSIFGRHLSDRLAVGRTMSDFHALDMEGQPVRPSDLHGRPALFMFYRGNWCPFCMAQVKEITGRYRELADLGVELVLISPQPTELTHRVAEMYGVPCRFWVDNDLSAARELGIIHDDGIPPGGLRTRYGPDTVLPTVVIVDEAGRILFTDQTDNYRVRPDPDSFLRVLQSHGYRGRTA